MQQLNAYDYSVIGVYFLILLVFGFWLSRRAARSIEHYFLGGRQLPWWALGMSGTASWFDITGTALIVSFLYMLGPRGIYIEFRGGACLVLACMLAFTGKWHRRSGCMTEAEWMEFRFGSGPGARFARIVKAVGAIAGAVGMIAYMVKGVGTFLPMFLPFSPIQCALLMVGVATLYTMASGFYGVVVTDVIQTLVILIVVGVITFMAVSHAGDIPDVDAFAERVTQRDFEPSAAAVRTQWTSSVPYWKVPMQEGYEPYGLLTLFAMMYLFRQILEGMRSGGDQRYFGARNERECGLLSAMWGGLIMVRWPMMMGFALLGLFLVDEFFGKRGERPEEVLREARMVILEDALAKAAPNVPFDLNPARHAKDVLPVSKWPEAARAANEAGDPSILSDRLAAILGDHAEPKLARLVELFGANWPAELERLSEQHKQITRIVPKSRWGDIVANVTRDEVLAGKLKSILGEDEFETKLNLISYEGTVHAERILPAVLLHRIPIGLRGLLLVALLAASMSTFDSNVNGATAFFIRDLYQRHVRPRAANRELIIASYAFGLLIVAAGFGLASIADNINKIWGWIIMSLFAGMLVPGILRLYWWRFNAGGVVASSVVGSIWPFVQYFFLDTLTEWHQFLSVMTATLVAAIVGTFLTRPTPRDTLARFYKLTRPFGWWKPMKDTLPADVQDAVRKEHRHDILTVPIAIVTQVTLYMLPMQLVIRSWNDFAVTLVIFLVALFGMYKIWYKNLPPRREGVPTLAEIEAGHL